MDSPVGHDSDILKLSWYLGLPFGRNPRHVQRGTRYDLSFHPKIPSGWK